MTLNELIKEAKEKGVDFNATILCKNEDQMGTDISNAEFDFSNGQITVANENFNFNYPEPWWEEDDYEESSSTLDDNDWNEKNDPLYGYGKEDAEDETSLLSKEWNNWEDEDDDETSFSNYLAEIVSNVDFQTFEEAKKGVDFLKNICSNYDTKFYFSVIKHTDENTYFILGDDEIDGCEDFENDDRYEIIQKNIK